MMTIVNLLLILLLSLFSIESFAENESLSLKGGFGITAATVNTKTEDHLDRFLGGSIHTQFGYRQNSWEFNLSSYVFIGKVSEMEFKTSTIEVEGEGVLESISFGPILKYITQKEVYPNWYLYIAAGPIWAIQTLRLDSFQVNRGDFKDEYKVTYTSRGIHIAVGAEEMNLAKDLHPAYIELVYNYLEAHKIEIVDASNTIEVETLITERINGKAFGHILMVNIGMTLF